MAATQPQQMASPPPPGQVEEKSWFNGLTSSVSGLTDSIPSVTGFFGSSEEPQTVNGQEGPAVAPAVAPAGGRRRSRAKSRQMQMRGGKSNLGLTYYATPVTDANVVQATYRGGSKRRRTKRCKKSHRHKKSCCRKRKSRRHRRH
jgi:hypothetical protein